jgi:WS/DGAT/MGAT family acyltransferase
MSSRERVSHVDTAWLRMDRPSNLMQIVGVMLFDGDLDYERLRAAIEKRMLGFRRFRQTVVEDGAGYVWQDDPDFDLDHHLHHQLLPGRKGKSELQHFVADLASTPLNPNRPLWEIHLVETALGGPALVMRIHHAIADGIALVGVIMSMMDNMPHAGSGLPAASDDDPDEDDAHGLFWDTVLRPVSDAMVASVRLSTSLWTKYIELLSNPAKVGEYARLGASFSTELARLVTMPDDSRTRFKGRPGVGKCVAWSEPISLPQVKAVGKVLGCSVNDMLLSSAAGALRAYMVEQGDEVAGVEIRGLIPVNMRRPEDFAELGNRFGLVALELPVGIENPLQRLYKTKERMDQLKGSLQAAVTLSLLGAVGMAPKLVQQQVLDLLANKATAVMTNVPGPSQALYLAGAKLREPLFWVPQSGDIGMGVSILSYDGKVQFGLITDKGLVPDPEGIVGRFAHEFEKLLLLVLMEPWDRLSDPEAVAACLAD